MEQLLQVRKWVCPGSGCDQEVSRCNQEVGVVRMLLIYVSTHCSVLTSCNTIEKAPWIINTSDSEYLFSFPWGYLLSKFYCMYVHTYVCMYCVYFDSLLSQPQ